MGHLKIGELMIMLSKNDGIMTTTGTEETGPTKVGSPYRLFTGMSAAFARFCIHEVKQKQNLLDLMFQCLTPHSC